MVLFVFEGRFFFMRMLLLGASAALVAIGVATIYAIGNPSGENAEFRISNSEIKSDAAGGTSESEALNSKQIQNSDLQTQNSEQEAKLPHKLAGEWKKQLAYAGAGLVCLVMINLFSYQRLGPISYFLYGVILVMLATLLLDKVIDLPFIKPINGARCWFRFGRFQMQPSEFGKIAFILSLAWYLRFRSNYRTFLGLFGPFALTLLMMGLILLQPDLGTTVVLMPILFSMLFVAGAKVRHLLIILLLGASVSPVMWHFMHKYQRLRVSSVLLQNEKVFQAATENRWLATVLVGDPDLLRTWKSDKGYHLLHSKQAIASGGVLGYGFGKGPYIEYDYLPERHNDFIFAMVAHQYGLWGCAGVLLLYIVIIACAIELAWLNTDPFGRLTAVGIAAMFAVQVLVNVSMTVGLMPITGLTLPLVSYGGSSLLTNLIAIGLLNNIGRERPFSVAKRAFEFGEE